MKIVSINRIWQVAFILMAAFLLVPSAASAGSFDLGELSDKPDVNVRSVKATAKFSYDSVEPGRDYLGAVVVNIAEGWHINSAAPFQDWLIPANLEIDTIPGLTPLKIVYPKAHSIALMGENMSVYDGKAIIYFKVNVNDNAEDGEIDLPVRLTYQPCNNKECRAPDTEYDTLKIVIGEHGNPINDALFAGITIDTDMEPVSAAPPQEKTQLQMLIEEYGFWGYLMALGLAFITGLLLSFSPCTYPMIPITVSVFAGQDRSVGRGFFLALFYVGSMAVVYGLMGLVVSLVGGVFGAWLASPPVVIGIAVIFVIFSLSMFGLYELNVPNALRQKMGATKTGGGIFGSIILGIVAALVVSPCVGPFVAGILLYIATYGSPIFGFLVLFIFALGLGTLYLIIGTFSSAITKLPRAGMWMDQIKKFFGFILLLMALFFLRTIIPVSVTAFLTGLLLLAYAIFGGGFDRLTSEDGFFPRLKKFLGIIAFIGSVYLILGSMLAAGFIYPPASQWLPAIGGPSEMKSESIIDWKTDLEAGLAEARATGRPVLIDTWATWCANCRVLDEKTFHNSDVAAEAKRFTALKIQLEKTDSPETKAFMKRFGLKQYSLPTTLLLDSEGNVQKTMIGVVEPDDMIAQMRMIR